MRLRITFVSTNVITFDPRFLIPCPLIDYFLLLIEVGRRHFQRADVWIPRKYVGQNLFGGFLFRSTVLELLMLLAHRLPEQI